MTETAFAWQAWHLATSTCILRGRRGTYGTGLALVAAVCVPGVALGDIDARRGDIDVHSAWQAWRLWHWTGGALGYFGRCGCLRGRRGTWRHRPILCVAGVALVDIDLHFAWQTWHLWHWTGSGGTLGYFGRRGCLRARRGLVTSTVTLRGRLGTWRHRRAFCVARVALIYGTGLALVARLGTLVAAAVCVPGVALGDIRPSLCVAGLALGDIDRYFAWQAWHLATSTCILRGRCGTGLALAARLGTLVAATVCAPGVALGDIDRHFEWHVWHLVTFTLHGSVALGDIDRHFVW